MLCKEVLVGTSIGFHTQRHGHAKMPVVVGCEQSSTSRISHHPGTASGPTLATGGGAMLQAIGCRASASRRLTTEDALTCPPRLFRPVFPPASTAFLSNHSSIDSSVQQWLTSFPCTR